MTSRASRRQVIKGTLAVSGGLVMGATYARPEITSVDLAEAAEVSGGLLAPSQPGTGTTASLPPDVSGPKSGKATAPQTDIASPASRIRATSPDSAPRIGGVPAPSVAASAPAPQTVPPKPASPDR